MNTPAGPQENLLTAPFYVNAGWRLSGGVSLKKVLDLIEVRVGAWTPTSQNPRPPYSLSNTFLANRAPTHPPTRHIYSSCTSATSTGWTR